MHGILAENYAPMLAVMFGEIVILLLALFAVYYAIRDERGGAVKLIAPAVIWVISFTLYDGYNAAKGILHGDRIITEFGLVHYIVGVVIEPWIVLAMLPFLMSLIVFLILRYKSRE